jgi:hypothetical protein
VDYTRLPLRSVQDELAGAARETADAFGALDVRRLNWRPDATRWSVGQCFDHHDATAGRAIMQSVAFPA